MENEKRLIYADDLREEIESLSMTVIGLRAGKGVLTEFMKQYRDSVLRIIDQQPTVDAVPVRHGRWIKVGYACGETELQCQACKETEWRTSRLKYCPFCGAKMDLEV